MNLPLNIDLQQIFLHMLNFVILAGGLYFILYSPVKKFMDQRAATSRIVATRSTARAVLRGVCPSVNRIPSRTIDHPSFHRRPIRRGAE